MNGIPTSFVEKYGDPIGANSIGKFAVNSEDYVSWNLLRIACSAATGALSRVGLRSARVSPAYLPNFEPSAFAWWNPTSPQQYVIACNQGTAELLSRELNRLDFWNLLSKESILRQRLCESELTALAVALTMGTIFYHEVAHIVRFHLPFLQERERTDLGEFNSWRNLCEVDADKWSSFLLAPEFLSQAKGIAKAFNIRETEESLIHELLVLYGVVLHVWFAFFNQKRFHISSLYPHPLIRSTRIAIGVADNIPAVSNQERIHRASAVLKGLSVLEKANSLIAETQHPFELGRELNAINEKYQTLARVLDPALADVKARFLAANTGSA